MPRKSVRSENSTASPDPTPTPTPSKATRSAKSPSRKNFVGRSVPTDDILENVDQGAAVTAVSGAKRRQNKSRVTAADQEEQKQQQQQQQQPQQQRRQQQQQLSHGRSVGTLLANLPAAPKLVAIEAVTLALLAAGRYALALASNYELATLRATPQTSSELALLAGWRAAQVALAWFADLDFVDVGLVSLVAHAPALWLFTMFYGLRPATALVAAFIDVVSPAVAFYLAARCGPVTNLLLLRLRRRAVPPEQQQQQQQQQLHDRELVSLPFEMLVGVLSTSVYAAAVSLALRYLLPRVLVLYFHGIPTVAPAYAASFVGVLPVAVIVGFAASTLIFAPYVTTGRDDGTDDRIDRFDPVRATLGETLWWNVCGFTRRTRVVVCRTALVTLVTAVSTHLACVVALDGVAAFGAAFYAAVWAFATAAAGLALGLVGRE